MQRHTRTLFTAFVGATALTLLAGAPSYALDIPTPLKYDMGPFGEWRVGGGIEADVAGWNNAPSSTNITNSKTSTTGDVDLTNAIFIINSHGNMFSGADEDSGIPLQIGRAHV